MDRTTIRIKTVDIDNIADIENLLDADGVEYEFDACSRVSVPTDDAERVEQILDNASVQYYVA